MQKNGRLAVVSFHSLEDRIVKQSFRKYSKERIMRVITNRPIMARDEEIERNPRSRSAKLRVAGKI